jgi:GLPGLI family protein
VRFRSLVFIAALAAITGYSCKERGGRDIDQGEIHYSIEYFGDVGFNLKEYMPKTLIVSFKDNKILFEISAPIGNSGILNLSNPKDEIYDTYLSLFTLKYAYSAEPGEIHPGFEAMKGMKVRKTNETSIICGFNCKNAEVTFPGDKERVFSIWYTDEIDIKNPNKSTPFNEIDGVLMSFFFFLGSAEMHFMAENVYRKDIPDKTFERKANFIFVSRDQINNIINKMVTM